MAQKDRTDKVPLPAFFTNLYQIESRRFALWLPVCLGAGIWVYFTLDQEPSVAWAWIVAPPFVALASGAAWRIGWGMLVVCWIWLSAGIGFSAAMVSAHLAWAPAIGFPVGETVEGRVIALSRSASGAPRLLLDRVTVYGVEADETPARIRLTVLDPGSDPLPVPGQRIRVYASLMPTGRPVEPGAFDFSRRAYFERLGGVGISRGHVLVLPEDATAGLVDKVRMWVARVRDGLSRHLRDTLPGRQGAFAAAIIVGDRVDIQDTDAEALRASNLAHLLAISGLHMGILTGLVFTATRLLLALVPWTAYRWPTKKTAALVALFAGAGYLALSGATVATQRAFIMVAVAFIAVLLDRPAITLRALALAATIILLVRPISLLDAGFQMSFAATAALVAGYEEFRVRRKIQAPHRRFWGRAILKGVVIYFGGLVVSSLLAGLSTAPIAAYHFNRTAPYGLLANLQALPIMGFWIAPSACLAAVLAPFGLADPVLRVMGEGIDQVLAIAHWVGGLPGAVQSVHAAPGIVLGLIAIGGLWLFLWRGPWRFAGIAAASAALFLWQEAPPRPDVLIAPDGRLIGVMSSQGRVLDHGTAQSFAAKTWLRRDGDIADQAMAAMRPGLERTQDLMSAEFGAGWRLKVHWKRGVKADDLMRLCTEQTLLIVKHGPVVKGPCRYIGKADLARSGAIAVTNTHSGLRIDSVVDPSRNRLWTR